MKKQVVVSGRYNSTIAKMFALEDEMEMKALRESGALKSAEESLTGGKSGCVIYAGTSGDRDKINEAKKLFNKE